MHTTDLQFKAARGMNTQIAPRNFARERRREVLSCPPVEVVEALGKACGEVRAGRKAAFVLVHIDEEWTTRSLQRFEEGETQPRHLSNVVGAYSLAFNVPLSKIMQRAAELLAKDEGAIAPSEVEQVLDEVAEAAEQDDADLAPEQDAEEKPGEA
jgi:hypothetical protein